MNEQEKSQLKEAYLSQIDLYTEKIEECNVKIAEIEEKLDGMIHGKKGR